MANRTFTYLICLALTLALLGLAGNLMHLQELMKQGIEPHFDQPYNYNYNPRVLLQDLLNEQGVFSRIVKESALALDRCLTSSVMPQLKVGQVGNTAGNTSPSRKLGRFGFMTALNNHLSMLTIPSSQLSSQRQQCTNAPATACHVSKFAMLVTFDGKNLRALFLNLLSWLTYPQVSQIIVLLPSSSNATIHGDAKYGERLLTWHTDETHLVKLEFMSSLWEFNPAVIKDHEAIVWMNGNTIHDRANYRGLEAGLELWKRHADAVVVSQGWNVVKAQPPIRTTATMKDQEPSLSSATSSQKPNLRTNEDNSAGLSSATPVVSSSSQQQQPFCKHDTALRMIPSKSGSTLQIADLHYFIVHRNYLCFLSHSVLTTLHRFTNSVWDEERIAIAMFLTQLSGQVPRLYPNTIKSEGTPGKRKLLRESNTGVGVSRSTSSLLSLFAPRRLTMVSNSRLQQTSLSTSVQAGVLNPEVMTELAGFFGSLPNHSISWCKDCKDDEDDVPISAIPWLTDSCKSYAVKRRII